MCSVNFCISLKKERCRLKFPIYRHLRRYLEGVGGEVEPSPPIWCKRTFFQKKKNKNCGFCQVLCCGADIYSDDCGWVFFCVFFFVVRRKKKKEKKPCADVCKSSQKSYKKSSLFIYFVFCFAIECHRI